MNEILCVCDIISSSEMRVCVLVNDQVIEGKITVCQKSGFVMKSKFLLV